MRTVCVALAIAAIVAGCNGGAPTIVTVHSGSPSTAPRAPTSSSAYPVPSPLIPSRPGPAYGVLFDQPSTCQPACTPNWTYTVYLVGVDANIHGAGHAQGSPPLECAPGQPAMVPPPVSTSNSRAYFLDANGSLNYVGPNNDAGSAGSLPIGPNLRSMFSVSPDDKRIAVVVADFNASGATTKLYVEDLTTGANHVDTFSESGTNTLWPLGWSSDAKNLVLAKVPACAPQAGPGPGQTEIHVVDPNTANRKYTIGGPDCTLTLTPSPAGVPCEVSDGTVRVYGWTGQVARPGYIPAEPQVPMYLSPNGAHLAFSPDHDRTLVEGTSIAGLQMDVCGWIDDTHVLSRGSPAWVGDVTSGSRASNTLQGVCAGRIPGGL